VTVPTPTGWAEHSLGDAAVILDNLRVPLSAAQRVGRSGPFPYCGANGVLDHIDAFMIDDDVILLAEDGGNFDQWPERSIAYRMNGKIWVNNHAHVLKGGRSCETGFLFYALEHKNITPFISSGTRSKLTRSELVRIKVAFPDRLDEQCRIATALSDADELIAALERMIDKKEAIKLGMMQQLLTGRTRLPGFSTPWERRRLGELLAYEQPGPYLVSSTDYVPTGTPVLTAGKTFLLGYTSDSDGIFDAVPVIIFDDFTTASKYVDFPFKAKSSAMKMLSARPGVSLRYIHERMQLIDFVTVDHKRRWIAEYSKLEMGMPRPDEQAVISAVLEDADHEIELRQQRLAKARDMKIGMMQELLTGRTRLPVLEGVA
jgi:type I restriction enzyme, S subunit